MRLEAEKYAAQLATQIEQAKLAATKNRLRWSTTFALPVSDYSVAINTGDLDWDASASGQYVNTQMMP